MIGFYLIEGTETKDNWRQIFEDIISKGLKRILIIVSDDLLCYVHLQRNVKRERRKEEAKQFNMKLKEIRTKSLDFEDLIRKVCALEFEKKARESLPRLLKDSTFVFIPRGQAIPRIDGIFCKLKDNTPLSFIAFRHPKDPSKNKGVIFRYGIVKSFYEYYGGTI